MWSCGPHRPPDLTGRHRAGTLWADSWTVSSTPSPTGARPERKCAGTASCGDFLLRMGRTAKQACCGKPKSCGSPQSVRHDDTGVAHADLLDERIEFRRVRRKQPHAAM